MSNTTRAMRRDWLSKTLAGILLGFSTALGFSGLFLLLAFDMNSNARAQLAMWLLSLIWLTILGTVYLFRSGVRAWTGLGLLNLLIYLIFILFKSLS